ncbi:MAG: CDP-diacylglycerol--glycerol-3-phosphate 3-phosphatidyltransferase [Spirochaetes bacterium GWF1_41_5]|nr:MAG: CDP-diacylglycerol--glycerol-3-phosphate 3-phosphatidyltransferase [Spirochaetes bacterium GWF1_41_5]
MIKQIPNILTFFRIVMVPVFILFFFNFIPGINYFHSRALAFVIFILASITDFFDGYLARRFSVVSRLGEFVDPLADKILMISVFISFVIVPYITVIPVLVVLIIIREIGITILRIRAISLGHPMKTSSWGKFKTVIQMITIIVIFIILCLHSMVIQYEMGGVIPDAETLAACYALKYSRFAALFLKYTPALFVNISAFFTVFSGIRYLYANWKSIISSVHKDHKHA